MGRVIVIGSLNVDLPWRVAAHPVVGSTVVGRQGAPTPGGKGLNQAVAAVRLGAAVQLVGAVGSDEHGRWLTGVAASEGIDVSAVRSVSGAATGAALIVVADDGANTVTVDAGANALLELDRLHIDADDVVVAQLEVPVAAVAAGFRAARAAGARTVLNPSPGVPEPWLLDLADVVVVNELEVADLAGLLPAHPDQVVVTTKGGDGVELRGPGGVVQLPGIAVDAVDTTGAGDCFLGVLAAGLVAGLGLGPALDQANRAAALAVTRRGTVDAMPTAAELTSP